MTGLVPTGLWAALGAAGHFAALAAGAVMVAWSLGHRSRFGAAGPAIHGALALTAVWSAATAVAGTSSGWADIAETARNLGWLFVIYRLFEGDGRLRSVRPVRPMVLALAFVELLQPGLLLVAQRGGGAAVFGIAVTFRLMVMVGGLVLVHNLYAGAARGGRAGLRWPTAGIAVLWMFDLNYYTVAYLIGAIPQQLGALRGFATITAVALVACGAREDAAQLRLAPSRTLAFRSASLGVIGAYLVAMVLLAGWLAEAGSDYATVLQLGVALGGSVLGAALLPSRRLRGWLKVMLAKHLFRHRYDYRAEWLRFTQTIGRGGSDAPPLNERVIRAVADITESGAGLLLTPDEEGELQLAARWQWPTADVPAPALPLAAVRDLSRDGFIVDLDDVRATNSPLPEWIRVTPQAWALVPLVHYERLVGMVVLARPPAARKLDWEDFDLLRVVGRQLASYLSESAGQEALAEAGRFDDFNRRIAFVMHDIKNLASQIGLLARNAEHHAENPEFRADMLVTLRNATDKLNALIARLSRYGAGAGQSGEAIPLDELVRRLAARFERAHPVVVARSEPVVVCGTLEPLEQALAHLVQNAIDSSEDDAPVFLSVTVHDLNGEVEVLDTGSGMAPDFVRGKLFKPFVSTKPGGFGIGAYEARELVRAMGGRLDVESREGLGTRFVLRLPLASASAVLHTISHPAGDNDQKVA